MDKIILSAQNENELREMLSKTMHLEENETYKIIVINKPKKILFFNIKGKYEVQIILKSELEKEVKEKQNKEKAQEQKKKQELNKNKDKIRSFFKEFIVNSNIDIKIKNIKQENGRYVVNLEGKDVKYLIGEKGSTLNSFEYLLSMSKTLNDIKISIDSNNYKNKREESLRDLARKKGEKVLETGKSIKLNPMSARERKIIHEEISKMKELETESVGEEPKRCLVIKKKR